MRVSVRVELHHDSVRLAHNVLGSSPTVSRLPTPRRRHKICPIAVGYLNIVYSWFSFEVCEAHFDGVALSNPDFLGRVMGVWIIQWVIRRRQNTKL